MSVMIPCPTDKNMNEPQKAIYDCHYTASIFYDVFHPEPTDYDPASHISDNHSLPTSLFREPC
jgi:hypothetical protein